jgi:hypothetical protein
LNVSLAPPPVPSVSNWDDHGASPCQPLLPVTESSVPPTAVTPGSDAGMETPTDALSGASAPRSRHSKPPSSPLAKSIVPPVWADRSVNCFQFAISDDDQPFSHPPQLWLMMAPGFSETICCSAERMSLSSS